MGWQSRTIFHVEIVIVVGVVAKVITVHGLMHVRVIEMIEVCRLMS